MDENSNSSEDETVVTTLRLPRSLRDEMKIQAIRSGRSFNTHVVILLQKAVEPDDT